jgi:hypothetical protein
LGLARDVDWAQASPGYAYVVVCRIESAATLPIRAAPEAGAAVTAHLPRFATAEIDTRERRGGWVSVVGADLSYDAAGRRRAYTSLLVEGWASEAHLCAYLD